MDTKQNPFIPNIIEHVAGQFSQSIISIWENYNLSEYLLADTQLRHVWHAVLSASDQQLPSRESLIKSKRRQLLKNAFGSYPPGMLKVLSKLGARAHKPDLYRSVHTVLERGDHLSRMLRHAEAIEPRMVLTLAKLPLDEITAKIASHAVRRGVAPREIGKLSRLAKRLVAFNQSEDVVKVVMGSNNPLAALHREIAYLPYPEAPWEAYKLTPIATPDELASIARKLIICLIDRDMFYSACLEVQAGTAFYYRTQSDDHLLCKFSKFGHLGWSLEECRGRLNRLPTPDELIELEQSLSELKDVWC